MVQQYCNHYILRLKSLNLQLNIIKYTHDRNNKSSILNYERFLKSADSIFFLTTVPFNPCP